MRHLSKVRQREKREADKRRKAFLEEFPRCWLCGRSGPQIHEIASGRGVRRRAYQCRSTWIPVCWPCHSQKLQPFKAPFDHAGQLALKSIRDPEHYDRVEVLLIKGYVETHITEDEVLAAFQRLSRDGYL